MDQISIFFIKIYQILFSPDHGVLFFYRVRTCRFYPSCSEYTIEALRAYGFFRGWLFGLRRVARCHPWQEGGWDPIE
ncbi:MAG: hypothetical protein G01um101470_66 [Parcubacteria group bacterium Gr01-1014_70]|nr:MAG: hypothetical protein G01um101470_66 [Parcubacteria group bacterium Gr01-1014_70]